MQTGGDRHNGDRGKKETNRARLWCQRKNAGGCDEEMVRGGGAKKKSREAAGEELPGGETDPEQARQVKTVKEAACAAYPHNSSKGSSREEAALLLDQVRGLPFSQGREAGAQVRPSTHSAAAGVEDCQEPGDCQRSCW